MVRRRCAARLRRRQKDASAREWFSIRARERIQTARPRACESPKVESSDDPSARKTLTCLSRPLEGRCGRARGCEKHRVRFRRGGLLRLRPPAAPPRLLPGHRRRCRRTRPCVFAAASRRTTPRTPGPAWIGSYFGRAACASGRRRREGDGCQRDETKRACRRRRRVRDLVGRHAQRGDEVHDAPKNVGDDAQPVRRAAAHDRAVAHVRHGSSSLDRAARLEL